MYSKSRQASLFVFPDGSIGGNIGKKNEDGFGKYFNISGGGDYSMTKELKNILTNNGKATPYQIIENISKYSSIYASTLKEILDNPKENVFVYNKYVQGSGAIVFSELLKLLNFEKTKGHITIDNEGKKSRFALITGEGVSVTEIDRVLDKVFNNPKNKYGEYIQVIIGSQVIGEGKTLKNVRQIHIQTPHWNNPETEQALGRGIRAFSHDDLPDNERFIKIYRHASIPLNGLESVNYMMYKISEDKEFKMKMIERLCKEEAVDCAINWDRNNLESDVDGSRECDYMKCDYKCSNITPKTINTPRLINDTYNLFYADSEIKSIIEVIRQLFKSRFSYDLGELLGEFSETSLMIIIRAVKEIIDKSLIITNKYGFPCYLREDHNLYFLVDDIILPNSFLLERYCKYPNVKTYYNFEDIIKLSQYRYSVEDKTFLFENYSKDDDKEMIIDQLSSLDPSLQEYFLEASIIADKNNIDEGKEVRDIILEHYKNYIVDLKDKKISTFLSEKDGIFKCLLEDGDEISDWEVCNKNMEEEIDNMRDKEKVSLEKNPYGYYGRIIKDPKKKNKFKIITVQEEKSTDKRKNLRGTICMDMVPLKKVSDIITHINKDKLNIKPDIDIKMKDKSEFIKEILKEGSPYTRKDLKEMSDERLKNVYYWYTKSKKEEMCNSLEKWFKKKKLLEYEK